MISYSTSRIYGDAHAALVSSLSSAGYTFSSSLTSGCAFLVVAEGGQNCPARQLAEALGVEIRTKQEIGAFLGLNSLVAVNQPPSRCRACFCDVPSSALFPHPFLCDPRALVCSDCFSFLSSPGWRSYNGGQEQFCRFCGDSELDNIVCDRPGCGRRWCEGCLRANLGSEQFCSAWLKGESRKWECLACKSDGSNQILPELSLHCRAERGDFSPHTAFLPLRLAEPLVSGHSYHSIAAIPHSLQQFCEPLFPSADKPRVRLLSCSLYRRFGCAPDDHAKYFYGLVRNLKKLEENWPGWKLRIYYDDSLTRAMPENRPDEAIEAKWENYQAYPCRNIWENLLEYLKGHPTVELAYVNWPYLKCKENFHLGHSLMLARFLALSDLGRTVSEVSFVDLDNLWTRRARELLENFDPSKKFMRFREKRYVFPLMGGGVHFRHKEGEENPFKDIERWIHEFCADHLRAPDSIWREFGHLIVAAENSGPNLSLGHHKPRRRFLHRSRAHGAVEDSEYQKFPYAFDQIFLKEFIMEIVQNSLFTQPIQLPQNLLHDGVQLSDVEISLDSSVDWKSAESFERFHQYFLENKIPKANELLDWVQEEISKMPHSKERIQRGKLIRPERMPVPPVLEPAAEIRVAEQHLPYSSPECLPLIGPATCSSTLPWGNEQ